MMTAGEKIEVSRRSTGALAATLVVTAAAFVAWAIHGHFFNLNGTIYHRWDWRNIQGSRQYLLFAVLSIPFFLAQWMFDRRPVPVALPLGLMMFTMFALMIGFAVFEKTPAGFSGVVNVVLNPIHGGYFTEADRLRDKGLTVAQWLANYPKLLPTFSMHPREKPPGAMLCFWDLIVALGSGRNTAIAGGILIGALATLSLPAVYLFVKHFTRSREAAFAAASFYALCPSLLLIFPRFDQDCALLTVGLTILWSTALRDDHLRRSIEFGLLLSLTLFITYLPAVLAIFCAGCIWLRQCEANRLPWRRITQHCLTAMISLALFYAALWLVTGFNPIATFRVCLQDQGENLRLFASLGYVPRTWPGTIPGDLYDFDLGAGWIAYLIVGLFFLSAKTQARPWRNIAILCVAQFLLVGLLGLIQCETARVWIFMLPMLMLPLGLELASWNFAWRTTTYAALLVITVAAWQSMTFFPQ